MKKQSFLLIILSLIVIFISTSNVFALGENESSLSSYEIESLNKYDTKLAENESIILLKEHNYLDNFLKRLDFELSKKISNELPEKLDQLRQWGLNPNDNLRYLEKLVQLYLDNNKIEISIGSTDFDALVNKYLSDESSSIVFDAKKNSLIGQVYLYMCIYNNMHNSTSTDINDPVFSDKYYEKTLEEICRDDIILDFSSSDINGILRNYIEEVSLNFSPPQPALNGQAIESYARTWALSRNTYYKWYDVNNDCTDFASQALYYGGLYKTYVSSDQSANGVVSTSTRWFYFNNGSQSGYSVSTSFIRVLDLYNYLSPNYATFSTTSGTTMTPYLNRGFILQGKLFIGDYIHSVVITLVSGSPRYCAHSNARYDEPIQSFYDYYSKYRVVQVY